MTMSDLNSTGIRRTHGQLWVLDQTLLPLKENWLQCNGPQDMIAIIKTLKIRGAPLIGVGAALCLAQYVKSEKEVSRVLEAAQNLRKARPTAVNLMICIDRLLKVYEASQYSAEALYQEADRIFVEDVELCEGMARSGEPLIDSGDHILTHCNTGGLATAGRGTIRVTSDWLPAPFQLTL